MTIIDQKAEEAVLIRAKLLNEVLATAMNQRSEDVISVMITVLVAEVIATTRTIERSRLVMGNICELLGTSLEQSEPTIRRAMAGAVVPTTPATH